RGSFRDETVLRASVALEEAAKSELWFVSEAGNEILKNATTQRVSIAIARLTTLGVPMEPQDPDELFQNAGPAVGFRADPTSNHHLKIYVDEHWPDSPLVFELLEQLRVLAGSLRIGAGRISIYQIDGHPLPPEKIARLKALYGDLRVQERGRVCLGIVQGTMFGGNLQGVLVSQVDPKSSAGEAGLRQNDVITRIDEKELIDFNDLVEELRSYRIGDVVTLKVIRNGVQANRTVVPQPPPLNPPPEQPSGEEQLEIKVTLKGWYDPAILNKKADATQKPESTAVE
ncbi:MAG: PDZ domain-containing protein, partial [Planctomycetaceae bacterium]